MSDQPLPVIHYVGPITTSSRLYQTSRYQQIIMSDQWLSVTYSGGTIAASNTFPRTNRFQEYIIVGRTLSALFWMRHREQKNKQ